MCEAAEGWKCSSDKESEKSIWDLGKQLLGKVKRPKNSDNIK